LGIKASGGIFTKAYGNKEIMKPADQLKEEHRTISRALAGLSGMARALDEGKQVPPELFRQELDFIKNFADNCHHRKEEAVLFPALEEQLVAATEDPLTELVEDHEEGAALVESLGDAVEAYAAGDAARAADISRDAKSYVRLLTAHIRKENATLVRLIEDRLPADKKLEVAERFELIEEDLGPDFHRTYAKLADKLRAEGRKLAA
jgi:hemerythrin-like domain-containing protein